MNKSPSHFIFKPAVESQRDLIHGWLQQDYIREWIHGQGLKNTHLGLENFFQYRADNKELDFQSDITQHWIGYDGDKPFVYLLTSNVLKNTDDQYAKYSEMNGLAITLDIFIGDAKYLGKGLASIVIKEFLLSQFSNVSEVFIDPEQKNARAIHVYKKVGFHIIDEFIAMWHPTPHYIMKLNMKYLTDNQNKKFILRKFQEADALNLYNALSDKRVAKHMASSGITIDDCKKIISTSIDHWEQYHIGSYGVIAQETNKIVGWAGFKFWKKNEFEILIVLSPKHWGLGGDICDELLKLAKNEFSLNRVFILLPETRKSFRWIQSKGFKFCGNEIFNAEPFKKFVSL